MIKPVVLITGCSSGLGLALAKHLVTLKKYRLIISARDQSIHKIKEFFDEDQDLMILELDMTQNIQINRVVSEVVKNWGSIDVVVNNAGICFRSVVEHMDPESEAIQLQTNYLGPMSLIRAVLPLMREKQQGKIINISSVSGLMSMPTMSSYSASKHALEGATESLWYEAKPYGIQVCLIEPGFIHSDSFKNVVMSKKADLSQRLNGPHSEYYYSMEPLVEKLMRLAAATPESIAVKIEKIIQHRNPPLRVQVTLDAQIFYFLRRWLPARLFHHVMYYLLPGSQAWGSMRP